MKIKSDNLCMAFKIGVISFGFGYVAVQGVWKKEKLHSMN